MGTDGEFDDATRRVFLLDERNLVQRPLDAAFAAIDALTSEAKINCLSTTAEFVAPPPALIGRAGSARLLPTDVKRAVLYPEDMEAAQAGWAAAIKSSERVADASARMLLSEGAPTWHRLRFIDLLDAPGFGVVVVAAERTVDHVPAHLTGGRSWLRSSADFHIRVSAAGVVLDVTPNVGSVLGLAPDEIVGGRVLDLVHPEDQVTYADAWASLLADAGGCRSVRHRMRTSDGGWRWIEATDWNLLAERQVGAVVGECRDIHEQVVAETAVRASEEQFRTLAESFPTGVVMTDANAHHIYSNQRWRDIVGFDDGDIGLRWFDTVHPEDRDRVASELLGGLLEGQPLHQSFRIRRASDGAVRHCRAVTRITHDQQGNMSGAISSLHDATDEVDAENEKQRLLQILEETSDCVLVIGRDDGVFQANAAARRTFGRIIGRPLEALMAPETRDRARAQAFIDVEAGRTWRGEVEMVDAQGRTIPMSMLLQPHADTAGKVIYLWATLRDITEQKSVEIELARQARRDPLTELPNRLAIMELLRSAQSRADARSVLAVLFIDLDNLKVVNDSLGHGAGDELLVAVADRLEASLRPDDVLGRFGGDEFVVICPHLADSDAALAVAERLLATVRRNVILPSTEVQVSASIGVAIDAGDGRDAEALIRDADTAMYEAKRLGRNRARLFDGELRQRVTHRLRLEGQLRDAIGTGQLEVWFQPVVDTHTLEVRGVEGLVRWAHPELGLIVPDDFIPLAEETGIIVPLGYEVLARALAAGEAFQNRFPGIEGLNVGVNLSGRQFTDPECAQHLLDIINASAIPMHRVVLELTESVLLDQLDNVESSLRLLREAGLQLALDDFGSGYSSLSYLRRYPVQVLKLDTSYTQALGSDPETRVIAEAITTMAHRLGLMVVAEGVETAEELAIVRDLGVTRAQGFLLGRPVRPEDLQPPTG